MFYGVFMSVSGAQVDVILQQDLDAAGVLRVTLDDSARRNALSTRMLGELKEVLDRVASDAQVRVLVLAATGPAFSAGHDLKEITLAREHDDAGRSFFKDLMDQCATVMQAIINNPKPVIAEVSGVATAAGCQLVASCDLAYAAPTARFATPGVHIGLFCSTPMVALSRNVSNKAAMEMLLTGEMLSAEEASRIGLVNRVVPAEALSEFTMNMALTIAGKSTMTVATGKQAFYRQREMPLDQAYAYASEVMVDNMLKQDAREGIGAFVEKRVPQWQDE
jgi:enoyl-CoA hydratase/carnithine racemase|tara:strand:- start:78 stop:911 length:834 start_codon:yes stop_codon:yes gene_type:complete